jgi:hypothetical protein
MQHNNIGYIEAARTRPAGKHDTAYGVVVGKTATAVYRTVRAYFLTI